MVSSGALCMFVVERNAIKKKMGHLSYMLRGLALTCP